MRYSPWAEVTALDVLVVFRVLPSGHGWWCPEDRVIVLDERLSPIERLCTLAHEVQHVLADDSGCGQGMEWFDQRQETRADEAAARKLITVQQLADVELFGKTLAEVAERLWVDVPTLDVRRGLLTDDEKALINRRAPEWGAA